MAYWFVYSDTALKDDMAAANCDFTGSYLQHATKECRGYWQELNALTSDINIYNTYGTCYGTSEDPQLISTNSDNGFKKAKKGFTAKDYTPWRFPKDNDESNDDPADSLPPCLYGVPVVDYMNRDDVRRALHIPDGVQDWEMCTSASNWHYIDEPRGSQWAYEELAGKIRMLHYSGDTDGSVPTIGTRAWIDSLGWNTTEAWRPFFVDEQVGGYVQTWEDTLTLGTVHGAGHMAP